MGGNKVLILLTLMAVAAMLIYSLESLRWFHWIVLFGPGLMGYLLGRINGGRQ